VGVTSYLIDKSALARLHLPAVRDVLVPLMDRGLVAICGPTELEILHSARNIQDRSRLRDRFRESCDLVATPDDLWAQAADLQEAMTERGQHRAPGIVDLIIAVTAQAHRMTVLHYDRDFDTIAAFTEQPTRWVVPAGTADIVLPGQVLPGRPASRTPSPSAAHKPPHTAPE
jgi:predicted nucleic acid-binding protein